MSPAKTDLTAVVVIPPEEQWEPIQAIRRRHDPRVEDVMPHVTLLRPFRPREEFKAATEKMTDLGLRPFRVVLTTFCTFRGVTSNTFWLAPEPVETWMRLQAALHERFPDCDDVRRYDDGFRPHLTVGDSRTPGLERDLQPAWQPILFEAREVSLMARQGLEPFEVICKMPLD